MTPHYHHVNFLKIAAAAILFLMDSSQKLIRSSEIHRKQPYQICVQSNQRFISYRAHKLFRRRGKKNQCWFDAGPASKTLDRHWFNT